MVCCHRRLVGPLITSILFILIAAITVIGGVAFVAIEASSSQIRDAPHRLCLEKVQKKMKNENVNWTDEQVVSKTLLLTDECLTRESRIDSLATGFMFVWSVYTTVGYGDSFPHTAMGRLMTVIYATITIPLYIALKANSRVEVEFGQLVSSSVLKVATVTEKWWCSWRMEEYSAYPSKIFICGISFGCAIIYICITTIIVSCVEGWSISTTFYYTFITVHLIGFGDSRFRVGVQYLCLFACENATERSISLEDDPQFVESAFPSVSTTFMPLDFARDEQLKTTLLKPGITTSTTKPTMLRTLPHKATVSLPPSLLE
uniref:Ion_trans_2 domain-containing protein n=1 Tax=Heterorhabditis bacteriophora TaxID=37862 RepID=A0A1I7WU27_HETBA